jgi:bifunctional N-acetylglucosamine-1-phosphate-uridyltransferase/glucosamine-1-phosphate-acetyltransferase GlmU-like protein
MLSADLLFDLTRFSHAGLFSDGQPVWSALQNLKHYMNDFAYQSDLWHIMEGGIPAAKHLVLHQGRLIDADHCHIEYGDTLRGGLVITRDGALLEGGSLIMAGAVILGSRIAIGKGALVEGGATIKAPAIIGNHTEVRQGAYLRGYCLIGDRCVVGHTTEVKHSIFLDDAKAGHFAYLGDSIIGNDANLGAGTKCANLRFIPGNVQVNYEGELCSTGMRKFGAILGDKTQTGCNSVTSPGTVIARGCFLMPNTTAPSGFLSDRKIG